MRRRARTTITFLAFGALTTVGVAWAIHLTASPRGRATETYYRARIPERGEGAGALDVQRARAPGKTWLKLLIMYPSPNGPKAIEDTMTPALPDWECRLCTPWNSRGWPTETYDRAYVTAVGWPCRALWHEYLYNPARDQPPAFLFFNQHPPAHTFDTPGAIRLGQFTTEFGLAAFPVPASLPYRPLIMGFAVNTAFYAALWFVVLVTPGSVRRYRRAWRGLCPSCAYDLRNTPPDTPCPECGVVTQRRQSPA